LLPNKQKLAGYSTLPTKIIAERTTIFRPPRNLESHIALFIDIISHINVLRRYQPVTVIRNNRTLPLSLKKRDTTLLQINP